MKAPTQEAIDDAMLQAGNDAQTCPAKSPATGGCGGQWRCMLKSRPVNSKARCVYMGSRVESQLLTVYIYRCNKHGARAGLLPGALNLLAG